METTMNLKPHPAAERFPMLEGPELQALADDIGTNGLQEPITLYGGEILDGRNRYRACRMAGVDPRTVNYDGPLSPEAFVVSMNIRRRHLKPGQIAMIVEKLKPEFREAAKQRQIDGGRAGGLSKLPDGRPEARKNHHSEVDEIAGAVGGVSGRSVRRATAVREADPELAGRVEAGEVSLESAYQQVKGMTASRIPGTKQRATTYREKSSKHKKTEQNMRQRVFDGLSLISGACAGLEAMRMVWLRDSVDAADLRAILTMVRENIRSLGDFKRRLEDALSDNGNPEIPA